MTAWRDQIAGTPQALLELAAAAVAFMLLALVVKRARAWSDCRAAAGETRINLILHGLDHLTIAPLMVVTTAAAHEALHAAGWTLPLESFWTLIGAGGTGLAVLFLGDFIGYWRHRAQHSGWLWPSHAIHHSDTQLTWLSLLRQHPLDRLGTLADPLILAALGFPVWALALNALVRHYYGYLIHADLPWSLGKAGLILNTPIMHRWHHARDIEGSGSNFATVFSVFDRAFGTYYAPGPCDVPTGVREPMGPGALGQYLHPFKVWLGRRPAPAIAAE